MSDKDTVISIISMVVGCLIDKVESAKNLKEDIGMDSLDEIEIVMEMEKEFDVSIPDESYGGFTTVNQFVNLLDSN